MKDTEIIEAIISKLNIPSGRHLYGVLGSYERLKSFAKKLQQARTPEGKRFPRPLSVNKGILDTIPDDEFRQLVENEAKRPEPTAAHVAKAFETFLRRKLDGKGIVVLSNLELLFAYNIELNLLRAMASDGDRVLLLLPGYRSGSNIIMFPDAIDTAYILPTNLIAQDHLWEIR